MGSSLVSAAAAASPAPEVSASEEVQRVYQQLVTRFQASRRPTHQVVSEELHNEGRVLVALLAQSVELGDSIVKCLLGQTAGLVGLVQDLVVEDREVQGKAKADRVSGCQVLVGNGACALVGLEGLLGGLITLLAGCELGEVTVVVTLPAMLLAPYVLISATSTHILW